jgi:glucose/mannose transport system substrate-binding protein
MSRKNIAYSLLITLLVAATWLTACGPTAEPTAAPQPTTAVQPTAAPPTGGTLEIFSWWTAGGEADGLNAMYGIFSGMYPDVEIVNATVAGGAGSNAKAVLATRMQAGDPPDSFQVHAGHELIDSWVVADKMEPVTFIFEENGWLDSYPPGVIDVLSYNGEIWSVPVNIHRSNVLWYNKAIFEEHGLTPPADFAEFAQAATTLEAAGIIPLALGDNGIWAATHLFESVLLGSMGPEMYRGLWTGETDWNGPEVQTALENFAMLMQYVNEDHAALSWDQAAQYVADGDAAMTIMGDWAQGYFTSIGLTADVDYGWAPSPGTGGTFIMLSDSFGLPKGAPNRDNAVAWLTVCGSKEGQDAFNPLKGSIPARTDGDRSLYDVYLLSAMDDFASNEIAPSLAHGAAASEGWVTAFNDVMTLFVADGNISAAKTAMAQACADAGVCGAVPPPKTLEGTLEIFSWWTAGGEADGLNAMYGIFSGMYPDVEIVNATVAGGAGSNAKAVLATRMQAGDPPDSFQVHAGHELIDSWVVADKMEPVTFIFENNGWLDDYPPGVIDVLSYNGEIWSVPVNIHRSNVLWYNKTIFEEYSLSAPTTFDEFFAAADTLQAAGVTPLALGDNGIWAATHLFESVLLGSMGPEMYRGLWTGETDWNGPEVTLALETYARMMDYVNEDHAALSWDQAAQYVADGDAAMTIMGDWAQGYFTSIGLTADVDYGWAPSPGTGGTFIMLSDSFGLPKGAPNRDVAIAWLEVCASKEGQDAFNPLKGSIPARTDGDRSLYDVYLLSAMDDFASNDIAPSLAHGAAASEGWVTGFNDVMTLFVADLDVASAQTGMAQACIDAGVCQ